MLVPYFLFLFCRIVLLGNETASVQNEEDIEEFTSIDDKEKSRFKDVLESCSSEIQTICPSATANDNEGQRRMEVNTPDVLTTPLVELFGSHHRSLVEEFDSFFDSFIRPNGQWVVVYEGAAESNKKPPCPNLVSAVASMQHENELVRNMAINFHPSNFEFVSQRLQSHGNDLLASGNTLALSETCCTTIIDSNVS
jgi:hypothetical protein